MFTVSIPMPRTKAPDVFAAGEASLLTARVVRTVVAGATVFEG